MSISFTPSTTRESQSAELPSLRITVVECGGGSQRWRNKCVGLDFRVHPDAASEWGLSQGDRVVGSYDEDGSWTLRRVERGETGYQVRVGGGTSRSGSRKIGGRIGFVYFRFTCTRAQARAVFGERKFIECDMIGYEGRKAMFIPKVSVRHLDFQPAS